MEMENRDGSETDTDIENKDNDKLAAMNSVVDHMYSTSTERKSPRFRYLPNWLKQTIYFVSLGQSYQKTINLLP